MTILTWPSDIKATQISWYLEYNTTSFTSPLTKSVQTIEMPGSRWRATVTIKNLLRVKWNPFSAFLSSLRGQSGRFYYSPTMGATPIYNFTPSTTIIVSGSGQTGNSLLTTGWASKSTVLRAGDYFSVTTPIGEELKQITSDVVSTEAGSASLTFVPNLRNSPIDGAAITLDSPSCIMKLDDDAQTQGTYTSGPFGAFTISMTEVIYA